MKTSKTKRNGKVPPQDPHLRRRPAATLKSLLVLCSVIVTSIVSYFARKHIFDNPIGLGHHVADFVDWNARREQVKNAFTTSWDAYAKVAFGLSSGADAHISSSHVLI